MINYMSPIRIQAKAAASVKMMVGKDEVTIYLCLAI